MRSYEYFTSFAEAADFARMRASLVDDATVLIRDGIQWRVEYTLSTKIIASDDEGECLGSDYHDDEWELTEREQEVSALRSDLMDDAENWARSGDGGWYYEE